MSPPTVTVRSPSRLRTVRLAALVAATVATVSLAVALGTPAGAAATRGAHGPSGTITVSAASSLSRAFDRIGAAFERRHPRASVRFDYGSSTTLAAQIVAGAPADVYASADLAAMDRLVAAGAVTATPKIFARNAMTIVVKPGNPKKVTGPASLPTVGTVALCGSTVPCGVYAASVLGRAGVVIPESHVTRGTDATTTLGAVSTGDADAAVVYVSDGVAAGRSVTTVTIPADQNVTAVYPVAPLARSGSPRLAAAFVRFVRSAAGGRILVRNGFGAP